MAYNLLKGKRGIILGALNESSLAWAVALKAHEEGATFTLTNTPIALRLGKIKDLATECKAEVIPADVASVNDLENLFTKSIEILGGKIDFVLHSVGMSKNVIKKRDYKELDYKDLMNTLDISAISLHKMLQVAWKGDYLSEGASVVTLSYIGAQRVFFTYNDMTQAKALLESIVRSFGYHYGLEKNVRINAVSQSPTITTAGKGVAGFDSFLHFSDKMSPLGNANSEECAGYIITLFSDLTKKVTMQTLYHDGGFSSVGISNEVLAHYNPECDCIKKNEHLKMIKGLK
jgi:enoyl-[acyl-carrier protein] reductase I